MIPRPVKHRNLRVLFAQPIQQVGRPVGARTVHEAHMPKMAVAAASARTAERGILGPLENIFPWT